MPPLVALVFVALAAVPPLLAVRRKAEARRLVRLFRAQERWAEAMDDERSRAA